MINDRSSRQQTEKFAALLCQLKCTLVLAGGGKGDLVFLGGDREGLIQGNSGISHVDCLGVHGDQVAVWGRRRLALMNRRRLLARGKLPGRLLPFLRLLSSGPGTNVDAIHWGDQGWWGLDGREARLGLLDRFGRFAPQWRMPANTAERPRLSGLAMADGRPAFVTSPGAGGKGGFVMDVAGGEIALAEVEGPTSPLMVDQALYFLRTAPAALIRADLEQGTQTCINRLSGRARGMVCYQDYLFIHVSRDASDSAADQGLFGEAAAAILAVHLKSGRTVAGLPLPGASAILAVL